MGLWSGGSGSVPRMRSLCQRPADNGGAGGRERDYGLGGEEGCVV